MNKRLIIFILIICLLFIACTAVYAAGGIYINSSSSYYEGSLGELFAIGSSGTLQLSGDGFFALTANGLEQIITSGNTNPDETFDPNCGLEYIDGEIKIKSNTVKVGLKYYYSSGRDSGVVEAKLENAVGSGYAFGYYDTNRNFVELARTSETQLSMRVTTGSGIGVYSSVSGELLYQVDYTDSKTMLGIMPLSSASDAITWFSGTKYYGGFEYSVLGAGKITVINVVDIEKYVMGVCASEMGKSWPIEALKAQAVAARTYVQKNIMSNTYYTRCGFDVTNDTYCQAYSGCGKLDESIIEAAESTANRYITYKGSFIDALYFSSDGGATEDNVNVNGNNGHPYLQGKEDPYEYLTDSINYLSSWQTVFTPSELAEKLGMSGTVIYVQPGYSQLGNVIRLDITSSSGETRTLLRGSCRTGLGLNSIRYTVSLSADGNYVFDGRGWGHNLGMSQFGAYSMARYFDKNYKDILGFYYTGVGLSYGVM